MNKLESIPDKIHALVLHDIGKLSYETIDNYEFPSLLLFDY